MKESFVDGSAINVRLEKEKVDKLLEQYGNEGLSFDGEFFQITTPEGTHNIPAWEQIPNVQEEGHHIKVTGVDIEDRIKEVIALAHREPEPPANGAEDGTDDDTKEAA